MLHGLAQGTLSQVQGGRFGAGFGAGFFGSAAVPGAERLGISPGSGPGRVILSAVVGGTASEIGGGKFANGAMSAAFAQAVGEVGALSRSLGDSPEERVRGAIAMSDELGISFPEGWEPLFDYIDQYGAILYVEGVPRLSDFLVGAEPISVDGYANVNALSSVERNHTYFFVGSGEAWSGYVAIQAPGSSYVQRKHLTLSASEAAVFTLGHESGWFRGAQNTPQADHFAYEALRRFRSR